MFACRCRIAGKCLHDRMIDQISIQSRIVCTSTVNCLTFVFTSTLTHLQHPPSVWPCIGDVNTVPTVWLLIDKACFDIVLLCKLTSHFLYIGAAYHSFALLDSLVNQVQDLDLRSSFKWSGGPERVGVQSPTILALSYFTDCLVNPWCVPLRT